MKSVESVPFFEQFDPKKANYEQYMESVVNDGKKTKRQEKLVSPFKHKIFNHRINSSLLRLADPLRNIARWTEKISSAVVV